MFENLSYFALQQYWWVLISLLGGLLVFLMFVQGGQTLIYRLGKTPGERSVLINTLGRKWEFTFTTLVTFGGAFFASFPLFYSTSFGGAYWVWFIILFAFIIQAVAYQYRSKSGNLLGSKTYEAFLLINGALGTILIGTAVGTFFTGSEFSVNKENLTALETGELPIISSWETPWHGLEAALNIQNLALGVSIFFLARILGILYFMNSVEHEPIMKRAKKCLLYNTIPFLVVFLFFLIRLMFLDGFAVNPDTGKVFMQEHKYWINIKQMPLNTAIMVLGIIAVLAGIIWSLVKDTSYGIWFTGTGTVLTVVALFLLSGFNNTAFYPSTYDLQSSLTITNSSSSKFTLTVMSYVSLLIPFVLAYIFYAWRSIQDKKITEEELLEEDSHAY